MTDLAAIILAAGASMRMKQQKMLLPFGSKTIIETIIDKAKKCLGEVIVVLGANHLEVREKIRNYETVTCLNADYQSGMLSSVICGFHSISSTIKAVLVFLGDQPQIPEPVIKLVIEAWKKSQKGIIIPTFKGERGHPVLIETRFRSAVESLDPQKGLRQLMVLYKDEIFEIECDFSEILRDIDTPEDYQNELKIN